MAGPSRIAPDAGPLIAIVLGAVVISCTGAPGPVTRPDAEATVAASPIATAVVGAAASASASSATAAATTAATATPGFAPVPSLGAPATAAPTAPPATAAPATAAPTVAPTAAPTPAGSASVSGLVRWWNDPLAGVRVRLVRAGTVLATATTDPTGRYRFSGLAAGSYLVALDPPYPPEAVGGVFGPGSKEIADAAAVEMSAIQVAKALTIRAPSREQQVSMPFTIIWSDEYGKTATFTVKVYEGSRTPFERVTTATEVTVSSGLAPGSSYTLLVSGTAPGRDGGTVQIAIGSVPFTVR